MDERITASALAEVWPAVGTRLERSLRARGVDAETSRDIAQEVAARVVARSVPFDSADDLYRWAWRVGTHLAIDWWRQQGRTTTAVVPEQASTLDVARVVEDRMVLEAVGRYLAQCSPADREAILTAVTGQVWADRREAVRWAVRRHGVRQKLQRWVDRLAAVLGWRVWAWAIEWLTGPSSAPLTGLLPALVSLLIGPLGAIPDQPPRPPPPPAVRAVSRLGPAPRPVQPAPAVARAPAAHLPARPPATGPVPLQSAQAPADDVRVTPPAGPPVGARLEEDQPADEPLACITNPPLVGGRYCLARPVTTG